MSGEAIGEFIPIEWAGDPDAEYVRGHVDADAARAHATMSTPIVYRQQIIWPPIG